MISSDVTSDKWKIPAAFFGYALLAQIGTVIYTGPDAAYFWPANAFLLAMLLRAPTRYWPYMLVMAMGGEILVDRINGSSWTTSLGLAPANALEAGSIALLMRVSLRSPEDFADLRTLIAFFLFAATVCLISGLIGAAALVLGGASPDYQGALFVWWIGDFLGLVVMAPGFVHLFRSRDLLRGAGNFARGVELATLFICLVGFSIVLLGLQNEPRSGLQVMPYAVFPFLVWAALRFDPAITAWSNAVIATVAAWQVGQGVGPFSLVGDSALDRTNALQAYLAVMSITSLVMSAVHAQRVRAERALRESESRMRTIADNLPVGVSYMDLAHRYVFSNLCYSKWWQEPAAQREGKTMRECEGDVVGDFIEPHARKVLGGEAVTFERKMPYSGETLDLEVSYVPHFSEQREVVGYFTLAIDVTEQKRAQVQISRSLSQKTLLLREVHHRIKNKLQIVSSLLNLQADREPDSRLRAALGDTHQRIRSMALLHDLLQDRQDHSAIQLGEYLRRLGDLVGGSLANPRRRLVVDTPDTEIMLDTHRAIPCGLLVNELATNAFKHAFPGDAEGEVRIELRADGPNGARLTVRDSGVGLPPDYEPSQATTLGHTLVSILVEQLNARLTVVREVGTCFDLRFACRDGAV